MRHISRYDSQFDEEYKKRNDSGNILRDIDEYNRRRAIDREESEKYYKLIPFDGKEKVEDLLLETIPFEISERKMIFDMFEPISKDWKHGKFVISEPKAIRYRYNNDPIYAIRATDKKLLCRISIWKLEDEWYLVGIGDYTLIYYKCDQIDGLKYFLDRTMFLQP